MNVWLVSRLILICTAFAEDLRIGGVGMDTSHVTAFTKLLNDTTAPDHVPGGKVVAAFKSGSAEETLELFAFMEAADESKRR